MLKIIKKYLFIAVGVLVVVNLALIIILLSAKINLNRNDFVKLADPDSYQAVFLNNDQIYFGHLKRASQDQNYLFLTDVYYVRVGEGSVGQLVKLGQIEPHRPTNEMIINKDHILFWENLSPDSPVVQTIQGSKNK